MRKKTLWRTTLGLTFVFPIIQMLPFLAWLPMALSLALIHVLVFFILCGRVQQPAKEAEGRPPAGKGRIYPRLAASVLYGALLLVFTWLTAKAFQHMIAPDKWLSTLYLPTTSLFQYILARVLCKVALPGPKGFQGAKNPRLTTAHIIGIILLYGIMLGVSLLISRLSYPLVSANEISKDTSVPVLIILFILIAMTNFVTIFPAFCAFSYRQRVFRAADRPAEKMAPGGDANPAWEEEETAPLPEEEQALECSDPDRLLEDYEFGRDSAYLHGERILFMRPWEPSDVMKVKTLALDLLEEGISERVRKGRSLNVIFEKPGEDSTDGRYLYVEDDSYTGVDVHTGNSTKSLSTRNLEQAVYWTLEKLIPLLAADTGNPPEIMWDMIGPAYRALYLAQQGAKI